LPKWQREELPCYETTLLLRPKLNKNGLPHSRHRVKLHESRGKAKRRGCTSEKRRRDERDPRCWRRMCSKSATGAQFRRSLQALTISYASVIHADLCFTHQLRTDVREQVTNGGEKCTKRTSSESTRFKGWREILHILNTGHRTDPIGLVDNPRLCYKSKQRNSRAEEANLLKPKEGNQTYDTGGLLRRL
jgi:hypothetical protein